MKSGGPPSSTPQSKNTVGLSFVMKRGDNTITKMMVCIQVAVGIINLNQEAVVVISFKHCHLLIVKNPKAG